MGVPGAAGGDAGDVADDDKLEVKVVVRGGPNSGIDDGGMYSGRDVPGT